MKSFIRKLLVFLGIAFLISFGLSQFYSRVVSGNNIRAQIDRQFYELQYPLEKLILGDSHSYSSVNPAIVSNSFPFSCDSENYIQSYYKLKHVLENDRRSDQIKLVILPYDISSFASHRSNIYEASHYWVKYLDYNELGRIKRARFFWWNQYFQAHFFSYVGRSGQIRNWIVKWHGGLQNLEHRPVNGHLANIGNFGNLEESKRVEMVREHLDRRWDTDEYQYDEDLVHYFKLCVDLCKEYNKKVVLVAFPISSDFYQLVIDDYGFDPQHKKLESYLADQDFIFRLDYMNVFFDRTELFADEDHLNEAGAGVFSNLLDVDLKRIIQTDASVIASTLE